MGLLSPRSTSSAICVVDGDDRQEGSAWMLSRSKTCTFHVKQLSFASVWWMITSASAVKRGKSDEPNYKYVGFAIFLDNNFELNSRSTALGRVPLTRQRLGRRRSSRTVRIDHLFRSF